MKAEKGPNRQQKKAEDEERLNKNRILPAGKTLSLTSAAKADGVSRPRIEKLQSSNIVVEAIIH